MGYFIFTDKPHVKHELNAITPNTVYYTNTLTTRKHEMDYDKFHSLRKTGSIKKVH